MAKAKRLDGTSGRAAVTISRASDGLVHIEVKDDSSRLVITRVSMELENFAECLMGLSHSPAEVERYPVEDGAYGKYKIHKKVGVPQSKLEGIYSNRADVVRGFLAGNYWYYLADGWFISDDGTSSQQNNPTTHWASLAKYVDEEPEVLV